MSQMPITVLTVTLKTRYENRRAFVREHISKIINAALVTKQESNSLRALWQEVDEQRRALAALSIQSEEMDIYTIHLVVDKLDAESRRQCELEHPGTDIQTYDQLRDFLTTSHPSYYASRQSLAEVLGNRRNFHAQAKKNWLSPSTTMTQQSETVKVDSLSKCHL